MRLRNISVLAAVMAIAFILMPQRSRAEPLLDTGTATTSSTVRDPGSIVFGQGVSAATNTSRTHVAMLLESSTGGNVKYVIWNGTNSSLLLSDIVPLTPFNSLEWILSDPLSFTLNSGDVYYFGAIQDANTQVIAPFFFPPTSVTQNGLTKLDTGNSNYEDFLLPVFSSLAGGGLPLRLYGIEAITDPVPEPSLGLWLMGILVAIAWRCQSDAKA